MEVIEVSGKKTRNEFYKMPEGIYRNDPNYTPLLRPMIENTFHPQKNAKFKEGDARRWIVKKEGECVGRIAAFFDNSYSSGYDQPTGCFGFFECIDDQEVADLLFGTARKWLEENGMEAMDGPVNFGENFFYWGLLADGFQPQTFGMQYHPPYYRKLFENYGFQIFYEQYSYSLDVTNPDLPDRFWKIAAWVAKKPEYSYRHFTFEEQEKYINDFLEIHRQAWADHSNYKPADFDELKEMIDQAKFILEEEFIWFVYHKENPIAFFMMIPDVNQIMRKLKSGKMNWLNIARLIYYKRKKVISRCRVIVLGVIPQFQRLGIESGIFYQLKQVMLRKPWYNDMEMSWVGDFNPKMNALFKSFGATQTLTHLTMRYLFDPKKEFKRAAIIS
ncbi:GNAT family N-acetyltransferase [Mariniphaga sediminis]|uniref:GNAT family N-acetyltransferase n=1 Tax=Mariniphaga sediminis TaxID=1628158 RepID=A0A399D8D3_9BACT|nr:GNAT family N-acetyltransferase [Mariniphaga sediminis]RIH66791.1 GNAT family N-acetyltransferase [Mariniphaga sediminis]